MTADNGFAMLESNKHALGAVGVLMALFFAFFWIGYFVGKLAASPASTAAAPAAAPAPTEKAAPRSEEGGGRFVQI